EERRFRLLRSRGWRRDWGLLAWRIFYMGQNPLNGGPPNGPPYPQRSEAPRGRGQSQVKLASRMSNVFLPFGSWAVTVSPIRLPMRARASGASTEMRPLAGSASSEPTI